MTEALNHAPAPHDPLELVRCLRHALLLGGGTHLLDDLMTMLHAGEAQLWQRGDGAVVTELRDHPQYRECNIWLVAGELADCMALQPAIEAWARGHGVRRIVGVGRDGWERVACRGMGFRRTGVALERWLDGS